MENVYIALISSKNILFKTSNNRKKITTSINICMSNRHLNIRKKNLNTISGSSSISYCIETHFRRLALPLCRWFRLEAQSFVTDSASVNEQQ